MPVNFSTTIVSAKSEIGIAAWQEQSDVTHNHSDRIVKGAALLVVKLLDLNIRTNFGPEFGVGCEIENFLSTEQAEKLAEAYDLSISKAGLSIIEAGKDTWFVWLNWTASRDVEPTPGAEEWFGSRGVRKHARSL